MAETVPVQKGLGPVPQGPDPYEDIGPSDSFLVSPTDKRKSLFPFVSFSLLFFTSVSTYTLPSTKRVLHNLCQVTVVIFSMEDTEKILLMSDTTVFGVPLNVHVQTVNSNWVTY